MHIDSFRWITVVLSIILGLGITRLLSSVIAVFRSRLHSKIDWMPLTWAACIFLWQLQFWWAIIELRTLVASWTVVSFLSLVSLTLLLFVAAALVVPLSELREGERLRDSFERDGRWALLALSAYFALALLTDQLLWKLPLLSVKAGMLAALAFLPIVAFLTPSRRAQEIIAVIYVPLSSGAASALSPSAYS